MPERLNAEHAKARVLVTFPSPHGGRQTGRLFAVGGRKHSARAARIVLASGAFVSVPVEDVALVPEAPRSVPT